MGASKGFRNGWIQGLSDSRKVFVTIFSSAFSWGLAGRLSKVRERRPSALHFPANVPEFSLVGLVRSPAHSEAIAVARRMCYLTARPGFCVGPWSQVVRPAPPESHGTRAGKVGFSVENWTGGRTAGTSGNARST